MTNVNIAVTELSPNGGATNAGLKIGYLDSAAKAAVGDTVTITNAKAVQQAILQIDADGAPEVVTLSTNVITLNNATIGAVSGLVVYR